MLANNFGNKMQSLTENAVATLSPPPTPPAPPISSGSPISPPPISPYPNLVVGGSGGEKQSSEGFWKKVFNEIHQLIENSC